MKNNNGSIRMKLICMVRVAIRASFDASGGIGAPCSSAARVHLISHFWHLHEEPAQRNPFDAGRVPCKRHI
jgi:hypothetical protein